MQDLQGGFLVLSRIMEKDVLKGFLLVHSSGEIVKASIDNIVRLGYQVPYKNAEFDGQYNTLVGIKGNSLARYPSITKDMVLTSKDGIIILATILDKSTKKPIGVVAYNGMGGKYNLTYKKLNDLARKYACCNFELVNDKNYGLIAVQKDGSYFETIEMSVPNKNTANINTKNSVPVSQVSNEDMPVIQAYSMDFIKDNEFSQSCQDKLVRAMLNMQALTPYYSTILQAIKRVPAPNLGTLGVTEDTLLYDMSFVANLLVPELTFVLIHEIMHITMQHSIRYGSRKNHDIWNIACDLYINSIICKDFNCSFGGGVVNIGSRDKPVEIKTPDFGIYIETIGETIDLAIDTPETIYNRLLKENNGSGMPSNQQGGSNSQQGMSSKQMIQQGLNNIQSGANKAQNQINQSNNQQSRQQAQQAKQQIQNGAKNIQQGLQNNNKQQIQQGLQQIQQGINKMNNALQQSQGQQGQSQQSQGQQGQSQQSQGQQGQQGSQGQQGQQGQSQGQQGQSQGQQGSRGQQGQGQQGQQGSQGQQGQGQQGQGQCGQSSQGQQGQGQSGNCQGQGGQSHGQGGSYQGSEASNQMEVGNQQLQNGLSGCSGQGQGQGGQGQGQGQLQLGTSVTNNQATEGDLSENSNSDGFSNSLKDVNVSYNGKKLKGSIMKDVMSNKEVKNNDDVKSNIEDSKRALQRIDTKIKLEEEELGEKLVKNAGVGGNLLQRYIEFGLSAGVDWRVLLRNMCKDKPKKTFTLAQPNQDYMNMGMTIADRRPIGKPTHIAHVKFAVDVSGSVSPRELNIILSEINNIYSYYKVDGELIYWSTMIGDAGMFSNLKDMLKVEPISSGGTDVRCVFEYLCGETKVNKKSEPDKVKDIKAVFILTDGCFSNNYEDYAKYFGKKVIWLITGEKGNPITFDPPFGRVIGLDI